MTMMWTSVLYCDPVRTTLPVRMKSMATTAHVQRGSLSPSAMSTSMNACLIRVFTTPRVSMISMHSPATACQDIQVG